MIRSNIKRNFCVALFHTFLFFIFLFLQFDRPCAFASKINYREEMRELVILISKRSREINKDFIIVPQNALELITLNGKHNGKPAYSYISAIDGAGCEELYYGNLDDGLKNPAHTTKYFKNFLLNLKKQNKAILVTDYVNNRRQAINSNKSCRLDGFVSFPAERSLSTIPSWIMNIHNEDVSKLQEAKNFLYLLTASRYRTPDSYLRSMRNSNADVLIIDAFYHKRVLSTRQLRILKKKKSGNRRLVLAYLSIGEAEDYRYYWKASWRNNPPPFLTKENPNWEGNYKVKYWMESWKEIICGNEDGKGFNSSYLKKIIDAGFDGVYLDILDAAMYFERRR